MISNSVSNKSWIFKKYNDQDVLFYKENYSLDEITSKLLSIRKIKKEDVQAFLNPSIKTFYLILRLLVIWKNLQKEQYRQLKINIKLEFLEIMMLMEPLLLLYLQIFLVK